MSGTAEGGKRAAITNKTKTKIYLNGRIQDIEPGSMYKLIGALGGKMAPGPFLADRELARRAGKKGGTISRRGLAKPIAIIKAEDKDKWMILDPAIDAPIIEPFNKQPWYKGWIRRQDG